MAYTIGELSINISAKAGDASKSISRLTTSIKRLKGECADLNGLKNLRTELNAISQIKLDGKVAALANIAKAVRDAKKSAVIGGNGDTIIKIPDASEVSNAMGGVKAEISDVMSGIARDAAISRQATVDEWSGIPQEIKQGIINPTVDQIKTVTSSIKNNLIKKTFGSLLSGVTDLAAGIKARINGIVSRILRIVGYRMIRSAIAAVTKEFREGLEVAYEWSANAENGFSGVADAMDSLASSGAQMKNQLGAAFGQLMISLAPFFNWLKNSVISAANMLTEFFASLAGQETYMKALPIETKWKEIEENEKDATKAAKEYRQQLLGIDELNILNTPSDKAGAVQEEVSAEQLYELAPVERTIFSDLVVDIKDVLFNWDNLDSASIGKKIFAALGALTGLIFGASIGGVKGALFGAAGGLIAGVKIGTFLFDADKAKYAPETSKEDLVMAITGGLVGAGLGFVFGGAAGAALGYNLGAILFLKINELNETIEEKAMKNYLESDFKKNLDDFMENTVQPNLDRIAEIKVKISEITPDLTDAEVTKLEGAKKLIEEIFNLDEKDNKTPEEIQLIKDKIGELNSLNIENVRLEFNDLEQKVEGSKDEMILLIDQMIKMAKVEAGQKKIVQLYGEAFDALIELQIAEKNLGTIQEQKAQKQNEVTKSTNKRVEAETNLTAVEKALEQAYLDQEEAGFMAKDGQDEWVQKSLELNGVITALTTAKEFWTEKVEEATLAELENKDGLIDLEEAETTCTQAVKDANDERDEAYDKIDVLTELIEEEKKGIKSETKAIDKDTEATETLSEVTGELTEAEKEVKKATVKATESLSNYKVASQDVTKASPKLKDAIDKCKGAFADIKSAIADSITELGKFDKETGTKRSIEIEYAVGANMNDAAMFAMLKGVGVDVKAGGGFAEGGHLFFANENGNPEYIGNLGGRTAVANSDQMSAAIEAASYAGMSRALAENSNNPLEDWKPMSAEEMYLVLKKKSEQNGIRTGMGYAF